MGIRNDPGYTRTSVMVPEAVWKKFRRRVTAKEGTLNGRLAELMEEELSGGGPGEEAELGESPTRKVVYIPTPVWVEFKARCVERGIQISRAVAALLEKELKRE